MTGAIFAFPDSGAQTPSTVEAIIAQVRRQLVADGAGDPGQHPADLDRLAESAVRNLWGGRVTAFVSVLALRDAREQIRERGSDQQNPAAERLGARQRTPTWEGG